MKASELIGKNAVRTAATKIVGDHSYSDDLLLILFADDSHIIAKNRFAGKITLNFDFCDNNWRDYDEMMARADQTLEFKRLQEENQKAIELLKEFVFYNVDDTDEDHCDKAIKVQKFLNGTSAKEWLEKQLS